MRFIIILYIKSIELIEINAILNKNEKLDAIIVAFCNRIINLIDNSNKEESNLIDIDNCAIKEINIDNNAITPRKGVVYLVGYPIPYRLILSHVRISRGLTLDLL